MSAKVRERWRAAVGAAWVLAIMTGAAGAADPTTLRDSGRVPARQGWESVGPDGGRIEALVQCPSNPERMYALPYRLGLFRSDDRGESWSRVESDLPPDTYYQALAVSPADDDVLLLAEQAGTEVLRSEDGGRTWSRHPVRHDWVGIYDLCFDPHDPDHVLLAARAVERDECGLEHAARAAGGLYWSRDGGRTWFPAGSRSEPIDVSAQPHPRDFSAMPRTPRDIAFDPGTPGNILVGSNEGLFRSTDGGRTWSAVVTPNVGGQTVPSVSFCRSDPSRVWAYQTRFEGSAWGYFLRSDDGGATFASRRIYGPPYFMDITIAADPLDPDQLFAWTWPGAISLYRGGWSVGPFDQLVSIPYLRGADRISTVAFDLQVPGRIHLTTTNLPYTQDYRSGMTRNGLVRSDDGGQSWSPSMRGIHGLRIVGLGDDATGTIWASSGLDLYRTTVPGEAWTGANSPFLASSTLHVDAQGSGILSEIANGKPDCPEGICDAWHSRSTDGGNTWATWRIPKPWWRTCPIGGPVVTGGGAECYVWLSGDSRGVAHMAADGSYEVHPTDFIAAGAAMDPANPLRMFVVEARTWYPQSSGTVLLTTDGGASWAPTPRQPHEPSPPDPVDIGIDLFMDPEDSDRIVVVYETTGVWETRDAGSHWRRIPTGTEGATVLAADWDPRTGRVFLVTRDGRVWGTGVGWMGGDLPTRDLIDIDYARNHNVLLLGTDHAGVLALHLSDASGKDGAASILASSPPAGLPAGSAGTELRLLPVAPSPFTGSTTIRYELPRASHARIGIHDVTGRLVLLLADRSATAGSHSVIWDGRDGSGARVAAGTYFVRLDTGHQARTGKVVYLGGS